MKVVLLPADHGGCGMYRMIMPGRALANDPNLSVGLGDGLRAVYDQNGDVVRINGEMDMDVLVLQRVTGRSLAQAIPLIQAKGVAVVVELDDDIERADPANFAYRAVHPKYSPDNNWGHLRVACNAADLVTVSTPALARYAPHGRVRVLPNCVPQFLTEIPRVKREPVLGWSGTRSVHPHDLEVTRGAIGRVQVETGVDFLVVGEADGVRQALRLPTEPKTTGWVKIDQYAQVLSSLDVGIVPLDSTQFNMGKSALKGLEMAALGIPFVATPVPDYRRIHDLGIGLEARNPRQWFNQVKQLVTDSAWRSELGEAGRAKVVAHATIERNAHLWAEAWEIALTNRRGRLAAV